MSKLDAQRAMREAKYARERASGPTRREAAAAASGNTAVAPAAEPGKPSRPSKPSKAASPVAAASDTDTCGHRSMNGRACTREAGHSEKSHRYS
jgi:hypothetical protein